MTRCQFKVQPENGGRMRKCKRNGYCIDELGDQFVFCYQHWEILQRKMIVACEATEDDSNYDASCEEYSSDTASSAPNSTCCEDDYHEHKEIEHFKETLTGVPMQSSQQTFTMMNLLVLIAVYLAGIYTAPYVQTLELSKFKMTEITETLQRFPVIKLTSLPKFPEISLMTSLATFPSVMNYTGIHYTQPYISIQPMMKLFGY
jgi:hypothetical protein